MSHLRSWSSAPGQEPISGISLVAQGSLLLSQTSRCIPCFGAGRVDSESTWTFVALLENNWIFHLTRQTLCLAHWCSVQWRSPIRSSPKYAVFSSREVDSHVSSMSRRRQVQRL